MMRILVITMWICLCFKLGDWKNWKSFYPTILYYIISDLTYNILTYSKPLWLYGGSFWNHTFADYFVAFLGFSSAIILFLSNFPKKTMKQLWYILFWVFVMSLQEHFIHIKGGIFFYNGWNLKWSILFYFVMFPLLLLHYNHPLLAWPLSIVLAFSVMLLFNIPFSSLR